MAWDHWWPAHLGVFVIIAIYSLVRLVRGFRGTTGGMNYGGQSPYNTGSPYSYTSPGLRLYVKAMWLLVILGNLAAIVILVALGIVFAH